MKKVINVVLLIKHFNKFWTGSKKDFFIIIFESAFSRGESTKAALELGQANSARFKDILDRIDSKKIKSAI